MPSSTEANERRLKRRFALRLDLHYKLLEREAIVAYGTGHTTNVSSGGIAFTTGNPLNEGAFVELSIEWPVLLDGHTPMRLVVYGRVVRAARGSAVCLVHKFEFRTQSRAAGTRPAPRHDSVFRRWVDSFRKETLRTQEPSRPVYFFAPPLPV